MIKNLVIIVALALAGWGVYTVTQDKSQPIQDNLPQVSETTDDDIIIEERNCLSNEVPGELTTEFLTGKVFVNYEQSGEQGRFLTNEELRTDWVSDDGYEVNGNLAAWAVLNNELSVADSNLSDGVYGDFKFYEFEGEVFAVPSGGSWEMFIGPDFESVEHFFNAKYMKEVCRY